MCVFPLYVSLELFPLHEQRELSINCSSRNGGNFEQNCIKTNDKVICKGKCEKQTIQQQIYAKFLILTNFLARETPKRTNE